ncbi:DUF262 domain-containing protein [Tenacibaculum maritimum]|uniref:DUF262 domain-containing protein n=1 Tax=Tenacibaculum maritimum TaxID=107401 RepID=UPI00388F36B5
MKLKSSISSNSIKLIDIYNKIDSGSLVTSPDFQRNLVWKKQHKYAFIKTILLNFPFPEVYIASSEVDVENLQAREIVVDGQQRLTTIVDYIKSRGDFKSQKSITPFDELSIEDKREFLNYFITVKDLKDIGLENIKEIFKRINSTNYSLNSNEILNAEYGGSEFALFCKQLTDKKYNPTTDETNVIVESTIKNYIIDFFEENKVFSNNDIKRMFNNQYLMLIFATIIEGSYFGRSTKINQYLKKYNDEFLIYNDILKRFENSIEIIKKLKFSTGSYWYNKANLFTLIVELNNIQINEIDINTLEINLLDLENKYDIYYNGEDEEEIKKLTSDETKYFEVARQGSHEFSAREHRGNVIRILIEKSKIREEEVQENEGNLESKNLELIKSKGISYAIIIPTETGLRKSIMDAVSGVREFLKVNDVHDYDSQELGPNHKKKLECIFKGKEYDTDSEVSLYRSNGRGDYRIWFSALGNFVEANDELALTYIDKKINVLNITKIDYIDVL